jgi:hypothetical protein
MAIPKRNILAGYAAAAGLFPFILAKVLRSMLKPHTEHGNSKRDVVASFSPDEIALTPVM